MHKLRILILYPDPAGLALLTSMLKSLGHMIEEATTDRAAVRSMERNDIDLVLAGVDPLDAEALELLTYVRRKHREVPVILLFPRLHPERAKEALRMGAMAVLKYPVPGGGAASGCLAGTRALRGSNGRPGKPAGGRRGAAQIAGDSHSGRRRQPRPRSARSRRIRQFESGRAVRLPASRCRHRASFHHSVSTSTPASSAWSATIRAGARSSISPSRSRRPDPRS